MAVNKNGELTDPDRFADGTYCFCWFFIGGQLRASHTVVPMTSFCLLRAVWRAWLYCESIAFIDVPPAHPAPSPFFKCRTQEKFFSSSSVNFLIAWLTERLIK